MKLNLKDYKISEAIKDLSVYEFDTNKKYLIMINTPSLDYTEGFLKTVYEVHNAFIALGVKSAVLVNPSVNGVQQFIIGEDKEIGSNENEKNKEHAKVN